MSGEERLKMILTSGEFLPDEMAEATEYEEDEERRVVKKQKKVKKYPKRTERQNEEQTKFLVNDFLNDLNARERDAKVFASKEGGHVNILDQDDKEFEGEHQMERNSTASKASKAS
jgi:hypothetical protein